MKSVATPIIICPRNLYLDLSPLEFFNLILSISSSSPKPPRDNETNTNVQT